MKICQQNVRFFVKFISIPDEEFSIFIDFYAKELYLHLFCVISMFLRGRMLNDCRVHRFILRQNIMTLPLVLYPHHLRQFIALFAVAGWLLLDIG